MYTNAISLLALAGAAQAHMSLWYPGPLGGAKEANTASTDSDVDPELNFPLGCCDSEGQPTAPSPGVCRGHLDLFDTEDAQVTWQPGQDAYFQLSDYTYTADAPGGTHYGGSCQVGFSTDRGETWKVAASYNGNCPLRGKDGSPEVQTFDFKVPTGMPEGKALFAWIWLNREHESFMNCAAVQIGEGSGNTTTPTNPAAPSVSATKPSKPSSSTYQPDDEQPQYSVAPQPTSTRAAGKPSYPTASASPAQPEDDESTEEPSYDAPSEDDSEETDDSEGTDNSEEEEEDNDYKDSEESDNEETDNKWSHPGHWNSNRHQSIKYKMIDEHKCKVDTVTKRAECECKATSGCSNQKRALVERKAVRIVRRDAIKKRADACAWNSAPSMVVSYYTVDAACAPNAKMNVPESDTFEIGWSEPCGVVEGDGEYPIKEMDCNMFS
ncbi:lytic polysaccharide monooxygenase [Didymella exigua CBS 183.55]|uniref:Lytic polysaccharide monooxygenase n=1 Tax=Didymella exigua CBS 183.55 TaxID=1150837 RepID=A0A6A5RHY0_9PLEO|nr:lytic polysaccharide monooxygenase [Didymella exigua CBS 183.55]KAF1927093.1 lytic polysaccharide monooxygenase [Didymella exigua CBS 183.55]